MNKDTSNKAEVKLSFTNKEFVNFYDWNRTICDEITGNKVIGHRTPKGQEETIIGRENFILAIRRIQAFVINYAHDFDEISKEREVFGELFDLEAEFVSDSDYREAVKRIDKMNASEESKLNISYFKYLFRCFNILVKTSKFLQSSMMLGTRNIKKLVNWYDTKPFFDFLSDYRKEISNDLSYFTVGDVLTHYKKVLAYHYTYRLHCDSNDIRHIDNVMKALNDLIIDEDYLNFLHRMKSKDNMDERIIKDNVLIKKALYSIVKITNKSLMKRNILPKIKRRVLVDRTGI